MPERMSILSPTGHLGFTPIERGSFEIGLTQPLDAFVEFDPALAIKFTIRRERPSGSPGERDVFGAQQYAPPFDLRIPL
jgi:hypothetical protein